MKRLVGIKKGLKLGMLCKSNDQLGVHFYCILLTLSLAIQSNFVVQWTSLWPINLVNLSSSIWLIGVADICWSFVQPCYKNNVKLYLPPASTTRYRVPALWARRLKFWAPDSYALTSKLRHSMDAPSGSKAMKSFLDSFVWIMPA